MVGDWEIIEMQLDSRVIRLLIYKQMCIIKTQKSEKLTNFKAETNRKKYHSQWRVGPMLSSVFWNASAHLSEIF